MNVIKRLMPLLAVVFACSCGAPERWPDTEGQYAATFERVTRETVEGRMLLFLPRGFDAHASRKYPLLIFLHGSGEIGSDLDLLKKHGPPAFVDAQPDFPFIVASPQSAISEARGFDPRALDGMLDELLERLPIDRERVYLTGLSMGGIWSYGWAAMRPDRFAAIAPMSGRWDPDEACRLKDMPIWAFHGELDESVPIEGDRAIVDAVNACGGHAKLTVYAGEGHEIWATSYGDPALYTWLLEHRRTMH